MSSVKKPTLKEILDVILVSLQKEYSTALANVNVMTTAPIKGDPSNTTLDYNREVLMNPEHPANKDMPVEMQAHQPEPGPLDLPSESRFDAFLAEVEKLATPEITKVATVINLLAQYGAYPVASHNPNRLDPNGPITIGFEFDKTSPLYDKLSKDGKLNSGGTNPWAFTVDQLHEVLMQKAVEDNPSATTKSQLPSKPTYSGRPDFSGLFEFFTNFHAAREENRAALKMKSAGWLTELNAQRQQDLWTWNSRFGSMGSFVQLGDPDEPAAPLPYHLTHPNPQLTTDTVMQLHNPLNQTSMHMARLPGPVYAGDHLNVPYVLGSHDYQIFWDTVSTLSSMVTREAAEQNLRGLVLSGAMEESMAGQIAQVIFRDDYPAWTTTDNDGEKPLIKEPAVTKVFDVRTISLAHYVPIITNKWSEAQAIDLGEKEQQVNAKRLAKLIQYCLKPHKIVPTTIADDLELEIYAAYIGVCVKHHVITYSAGLDLVEEAQKRLGETLNAVEKNRSSQTTEKYLKSFLTADQAYKVIDHFKKGVIAGVSGKEELVKLISDKPQVVTAATKLGGMAIGSTTAGVVPPVEREYIPNDLSAILQTIRDMDFARGKPTVSGWTELSPMEQARLPLWKLFSFDLDREVPEHVPVTNPGCVCGHCK
jgi:hypothetical protein